MKFSIPVLIVHFLLAGCGKLENQESFSDVCPAVEIDPEFAPFIELVRGMVFQANDPRMPVERLDHICQFQYASRARINEEGSGLHESLAGLNTYKIQDGVMRFDILINEEQTALSKVHTTYHEIMHIYFRNHDTQDGVMAKQAKAESSLDEDGIVALLRHAIFDEGYKQHMIFREN